MTPAFKNYILNLIKTADSDYGLKAGPEVTYADYNRAYMDGKTQDEYWREVVERRLLKVAGLYEEAWDPDTQALKPGTDFSKCLIAPGESNGFPQEWSSGSHPAKNQAAFENANNQLTPEESPVIEGTPTRPELGRYVWLKAGAGHWIIVFEGREIPLEKDYKALLNIQKLLEHPKKEFDAYGLSDKSERKVVHSPLDIGALIEEGLSISAGPMTSGGQKISPPEARRRIKKTILELKEERTNTTDFCRKIEIDDSLKDLEKVQKQIINQFPDTTNPIRTIKTGIDRLTTKIAPEHPNLAEHLRASIKRRQNCLVYEPTRQDINWELGHH